jgi:NADPH-dependent 2,4-dienoyl-CoA reductase/sulfur reductase-like enzyme
VCLHAPAIHKTRLLTWTALPVASSPRDLHWPALCSKAVKAWIRERAAKRAVVVGGGFIGLEMVENLVHAGLHVTLVEMLDQVGLGW